MRPFGVFAFDGGIWDYQLWGKVGGRECPVEQGLCVDLAVVMTEYGCSWFSCVCSFLLQILNDDFLGVKCLVVSKFEQLGDSETGGALGLVFDF